jgi:hypothetical protein
VNFPGRSDARRSRVISPFPVKSRGTSVNPRGTSVNRAGWRRKLRLSGRLRHRVDQDAVPSPQLRRPCRMIRAIHTPRMPRQDDPAWNALARAHNPTIRRALQSGAKPPGDRELIDRSRRAGGENTGSDLAERSSRRIVAFLLPQDRLSRRGSAQFRTKAAAKHRPWKGRPWRRSENSDLWATVRSRN